MLLEHNENVEISLGSSDKPKLELLWGLAWL